MDSEEVISPVHDAVEGDVDIAEEHSVDENASAAAAAAEEGDEEEAPARRRAREEEGEEEEVVKDPPYEYPTGVVEVEDQWVRPRAPVDYSVLP